jgi:phospholipase A1
MLLLSNPSRAADEIDSPLADRLDQIRTEGNSPWVILPYRRNYILPVTYSEEPNNQPLREIDEEEDFDNVEVKFQISFMLPIVEDVVLDNGDLVFAYSQVSFWNAFNGEISEPFRDTNYEPEGFLLFDTDYTVLGLTGRSLAFGFVHESNGRGSDALSRSWNRAYVSAALDRGNLAVGVKTWLRVSDDEENPGIDDYMGYGNLNLVYKHGESVFSALLRNNFKIDGNRGAVELGWSFPLYKKYKGFVQFFNGYAESLLDYDANNTRIGVGILLSDLL